MGFENISAEKKDRVGWVSIARPPYNVIDIATMKEMTQAIREFDNDTEVCAIVVTAAGDKAFSTGVDIRDHMPDRFHEMVETFRELLIGTMAAPMAKPRIAVVKGMCTGGGWEVANYCDMVLAREDARFAQAEIQAAMVGGPNAAMMVRQIHRRKAAEIILSGDWVDAREAERLGLVSKVLPAITERFLSKSDPKFERFNIVHCPDVGLDKGGWGKILMKVYVEKFR